MKSTYVFKSFSSPPFFWQVIITETLPKITFKVSTFLHKLFDLFNATVMLIC